MIRDVVGIMFSEDCGRVLLVQASGRAGGGLFLDGVMGMRKSGETSRECLVRVFREKTGIDTAPEVWRPVLALRASGGTVDYYFAVSAISGLRTMTDEIVTCFDVERVDDLDMSDELHIIIPFMLYLNRLLFSVEVIDEGRLSNG